ncbi:folate-binding protein YgfZ [Ottowia sp. GY511]|uniref:YgfZ/GcvT domain-containing protein n=1 Tax=Ottowia flava TaxID=2675430 RepID=A0ABW4KQQ8_9BURK|nr:folate-binding protein YgfZ [Ottowia sp. GY511]TXK29620.1 folate-binding protein YgfZ [Ottowia sp. GY511]
MCSTLASPVFAHPDATTAAALDGVVRLHGLGVIRAVGEQAATFLQGQLTQDVVLMPVGSSRLAAFCTAKGRMLASFRVLKTRADELLLVTSAETLPATLKRLSMFVLRAKVKLSDASGDFAIYGALGPTAAAWVQNATQSVASSADGSRADGQNDAKPMVIDLPAADGAARALQLLPPDAPAPAGPALSDADWRWAEIRAGVARVVGPVVEAFVPQMLNYESADGVNFKKGCYPGQEVVARSQFRGAIKRRAFVAQVAGAAEAGQEVFDPSAPDQPVGLIAQAAPAPGGGTAVIVSLQLAAEHAPDLRVGAADGPSLSGLHLPFALLHDI